MCGRSEDNFQGQSPSSKWVLGMEIISSAGGHVDGPGFVFKTGFHVSQAGLEVAINI